MRSIYMVLETVAETTEIWVWIGAMIVGIFIPTIITVVTQRKFSRYYAEKDRKEEEKKAEHEKLKVFEEQKAREELRKDMEDVVEKATKPIRQDLDIIKGGTQAGLRHDLYIMSDEWLSRGWCPRAVKIEFENIYNQYHSLGKNGVMDNTYQAILELPEQPPVKAVTPKTKKTQKTVLLETE